MHDLGHRRKRGHSGDGFPPPTRFQLGEFEVDFPRLPLREWDFLVFECPFAHEADAFGADGVEDKFGVVDGA